MKIKLIGLLLAACCVIGASAENKDIQVIGQNDEKLGEVKGVTDVKFDSGQLILVTATGETPFARKSVKHILLSKSGTSTSVLPVWDETPTLTIAGGNVVVEGIAEDNVLIQVINPAGSLIAKFNTAGASSAVVPLNGYRGIVIVTVKGEKNNKTVKLVSE